MSPGVLVSGFNMSGIRQCRRHESSTVRPLGNLNFPTASSSRTALRPGATTDACFDHDASFRLTRLDALATSQYFLGLGYLSDHLSRKHRGKPVSLPYTTLSSVFFMATIEAIDL